MSVKIAASVLACDFGRLAEEVEEAQRAGADWIHVDVMDGRFVPNISMGPSIAAAVRRATDLPVDVHLMVESPDLYLEAFADAGADRITVHQETCPHLHRTVERIRELGAGPGVALNPATPVDTLAEVISSVDLVLVMTVNPGFGGQRFIGTMPAKIRSARELAEGRGREVEVQVDGGIDATTAGTAAAAGASVLVAGSAVFRHPDGVARGIEALRQGVAGGAAVSSGGGAG